MRYKYRCCEIVINKHIGYLFTIIYDGDAIIVTDTDTFVSKIGFPRDRKLVGIDFDSCKTLLVGRVMLLEGSCVLLVFALTISLLATTKSAYFDSKVLNRVSPNVDVSFNVCSFWLAPDFSGAIAFGKCWGVSMISRFLRFVFPAIFVWTILPSAHARDYNNRLWKTKKITSKSHARKLYEYEFHTFLQRLIVYVF